MNDRRLVALGLSARRRDRLDQALRRTLETRRGEHAALVHQRDAWLARAQQEQALLDDCMARLDAMSCGTEPFTLDAFNSLRRYVDVVSDRYRSCMAELDKCQASVDTAAAAVAQTQREIGINQAHADLVKGRAKTIGRELDNTAADAADDDAQETATARFIRERAQREALA